MANVTFSGSVSAQQNTGETITITVTKPDSTKDTITATTLADRTFTTTKVYAIAGNYSVVASVGTDGIYSGATSPSVPFTIALTTRTVTLTVNLA